MTNPEFIFKKNIVFQNIKFICFNIIKHQQFTKNKSIFIPGPSLFGEGKHNGNMTVFYQKGKRELHPLSSNYNWFCPDTLTLISTFVLSVKCIAHIH